MGQGWGSLWTGAPLLPQPHASTVLRHGLDGAQHGPRPLAPGNQETAAWDGLATAAARLQVTTGPRTFAAATVAGVRVEVRVEVRAGVRAEGRAQECEAAAQRLAAHRR